MDPTESKQRKTSIIADEIGLEYTLVQQGKGKGRHKAKEKAGFFNLSATKNAAISKPNQAAKAKPAQNSGPQFYEKDGLKIPLYGKSGRKRAHARASTGLRSKTYDELLNIVEEYAGPHKRQEFKDGKLKKVTIADWIEEKETLAFTPNPKSKSEDEQAEASKLRHPNKLIQATELATTGFAAQGAKKKSSPEASTSFGRHAQHKNAPSNSKKGNSKRISTEGGPYGQSQPEMPKESHQASLQTGHDVQKAKSAANKTLTTKRKLDEITNPTAVGKHTTKKLKATTSATQKPSVPVSSPLGNIKGRDNLGKAHHEQPSTQSARTSHTTFEPTVMVDRELDVEDILQEFLNDDADTSHLEGPTKIVNSREENETSMLVAKSSNSPSTTKIQSTQSPGNCCDSKQTASVQIPYLKKGKHGPSGDFEDDHDRVTGQGHDYELEDLKNYEKFLQYRHEFYSKYPNYPSLRPEQHVDQEDKDEWERQQLWYLGFSKTYPGRRLDQWPCGCQKLNYGSDSESEEE